MTSELSILAESSAKVDPFADGILATDSDRIATVDVDWFRQKYASERDRRLREDKNTQFVKIDDDFASFGEDPFVEPGFTREPISDVVDVIIIGAGFAGLLLGARLRQAGVQSIRLIDRAGDVGGTWYWNRYPGIGCDVDSLAYLPLLEELGYIPERHYSYGDEIWEHCKNIARHFSLYDGALFQTDVNEFTWNEDEKLWRVSTSRGDDLRARFVVLASGPIAVPKLPAIPGILDFEGVTMHTARWDHSFTGATEEGLPGLEGKRVGIIGTGATAIQVVPHLARAASEVFVFQRTPATVAVRHNTLIDREGFAAALEPGWDQRIKENFVRLLDGYDEVDLVQDGWTQAHKRVGGIAAARIATHLAVPIESDEVSRRVEIEDYIFGEEIRQVVRDVVKDPDVAEALLPWYLYFCKRPGFSDAYLQSFNLPHVHLVDTAGRGVERLSPAGVVVDGTEHPLDVLILATGFEFGTPFARRLGATVRGVDGVTLEEHWKGGPRSLYGMTTEGFPNLFISNLVQGAITSNLTFTFDELGKHIAYIISTALERGITRIETTPEAEQWWVDEMRTSTSARVRDTQERCTPGYITSEGDVANPHGNNNARYGGGSVQFFGLLNEWREAGDMKGFAVVGSGEAAPVED